MSGEIMQTEIVEFTNLHGKGMVRVALSVPLPDIDDQPLAEALTAMSMGPLCKQFTHLIAASICMCRSNPEAGAQTLYVLEKKLAEAGTESLKLAEGNLARLKENQLSETFCFVMC